MVALETPDEFVVTNLQQQKSYGGFRDGRKAFMRDIYNSRNLMVALERETVKKMGRSTTVEILWWLQRCPSNHYNKNLQQQKSYGGFRESFIDIATFIYNSRNLMVALEYRAHHTDW